MAKVPTGRPLSRSENMARIGSKNTKPELTVRKALWHEGLRYRLHDRHLPGSPDIVLPSRRLALFVHGCFWHGHEGCRKFSIPKTRTEWWLEKISKNTERDARALSAVRELGWQAVVIWECETKDPRRLSEVVRGIADMPIAPRKAVRGSSSAGRQSDGQSRRGTGDRPHKRPGAGRSMLAYRERLQETLGTGVDRTTVQNALGVACGSHG